MQQLGDFADNATVFFLWNTSGPSGQSITRSTDGTVVVIRSDKSTSATGITNIEDFSGMTGVHYCSINTTPAFYTPGSSFAVAVSGAVIGGETVNATIAYFSMEARSHLRPTVVGRTLDVTTGGAAGIDWANIENPTATVGFSTSTIGLNASAINSTKFASSAITATAIAANAIGASELATDAVNEIRDAILSDSTPFLGASVAAILADTASLDDTKIPDTISLANINAQCDTALSDYGALKPTTGGRTLDVTAGGTAGVDWANVESPTSTIGFSNTTVGIATQVNSLSSDAIIDVEEGAAAAASGMSLDHLAKRSVVGTDIVDDSIFAKLVSNSSTADWDDFVNTKESLLALRIKIRETQSLIESKKASHTRQGNIYYVDPVNGDTHANGSRGGPDDPYNSVQDCHDNAITDSNHDVIFLLAGDPASVTTLTEDVTISKRYTFIRGPGRDFLWTRSGAGDTITITADGVELRGFQIETDTIGSGVGVQANDASFLRVHDCWINATQGDGINILRGDNCLIENNHFQNTGQIGIGQGIHIVGTAGSSNNNHIRNNAFENCAGDGILIQSGTTNNTIIYENIIYGSSGWGININDSSVGAVVVDNRLGNNNSGDISDAGTNTIIINNQQWSISTDSSIADQVWDEITSGHKDVGSFGHALQPLHVGTVPAGLGGNNKIDLQATASATNDAYNGMIIQLVDGTGAGQSRLIVDYDSSTKSATLDRNWDTNPVATSTEYVIHGSFGPVMLGDAVHGGAAARAAINLQQLNIEHTGVQSAVNIEANDALAAIRINQGYISGAPAIEVNSDYGDGLKIDGFQVLGTNLKNYIVDSIWDEVIVGAHDTTSTAGRLLQDEPTASGIASQVWNELVADHQITGTFGGLYRGMFIDGTINDASPATTVFSLSGNFDGQHDNIYVGMDVLFLSGDNNGIKRTCTGYKSSCREILFTNPFPAIPANGDQIRILACCVCNTGTA